jgi:hypothetical protein
MRLFRFRYNAKHDCLIPLRQSSVVYALLKLRRGLMKITYVDGELHKVTWCAGPLELVGQAQLKNLQSFARPL